MLGCDHRAMMTFERTSRLDTSAQSVWARVTTADGVNDELRPWLRMTVPAGWAGTSIADVEPGAFLGRSWILLFGLVPFDYDDLTIAETGPRRFLERSTLLSAGVWEHERTVTPTGDGCDVTDRITFESRFGPFARVHIAILRALFAHRHARLRRRFGHRAELRRAR
jgi:ligand-binding SRPBCC domain-containing protein